MQRMDHAIAAINVESDIADFIRASKSGAQPPPRAQYHPYVFVLLECVSETKNKGTMRVLVDVSLLLRQFRLDLLLGAAFWLLQDLLE